jgi:hypothetical protein
MNLGEHTWSCSHPGCKKFIMAYTEGGLRALTDEHVAQHVREDRENQHIRDQAIEYIGPRRNHNILELTLADIGFLKTRGIALDDKIELDLAHDPKPSSSIGLGQRQWARILDRAWSRESNGTTI